MLQHNLSPKLPAISPIHCFQHAATQPSYQTHGSFLLSSMYACKDMILNLIPNCYYCTEDLDTAENSWKAEAQSVCPESKNKATQKFWELPLIIGIYNMLISNASSDEDKARLNAISQPQASAWLNCLPSKHIGTLMSDLQFQVSCALRLGSEICQAFKCRCGKMVSTKGYHGLSCKYSSG